MSRTRCTRSAALLLTLVVGWGAIPAAMAADAPRGSLTSFEFRQLAATTRALNRSAGARSISWSRAEAACRSAGGRTTLLRTQRSSCLRTVAVLQTLARFPVQQRRCRIPVSTTGTSTTGTTTGTGVTTTATTGTAPTSPGASAPIRLMICMRPQYQSLAHRAAALYGADRAARGVALRRGLTGACLATLAPTPPQLRTVRSFARASAALAADVILLIRVTQGKAPSGAFSHSQVDRDVGRFERSATAVLHEHGEQKLSSCPHA